MPPLLDSAERDFIVACLLAVRGIKTLKTRQRLVQETDLAPLEAQLDMDAPRDAFCAQVVALCEQVVYAPNTKSLALVRLVRWLEAQNRKAAPALAALAEELLRRAAKLAHLPQAFEVHLVEEEEITPLTPIRDPRNPINLIPKSDGFPFFDPTELPSMRDRVFEGDFPLTIDQSISDDSVELPPRVTRAVDIRAPRVVLHNEPSISVVVRLAEQKSALSLVNFAVELVPSPAMPVTVRLTAPGFAHLNGVERLMALSDKGEGECVFDLQPLEVRPSTLQFDFFQEGQLLGNISAPIQIIEGDVVAASSASVSGKLSTPPTVAPADLMLIIAMDRREGETRLEFSLQQQGNPGRLFHPVILKSDIAAYASALYDGLNRLAEGQEPNAAATDDAPPISEARVERQLKTMGRQLWDECLPPDFRAYYATQRDAWRNQTLLIVSDEPYLPWELVLPYDTEWEDEAPWCLTYALTRWLRRSEQGTGNEGPPGTLRWQNLATIAPTDSALPFASQEVDYLKTLASQRQMGYLEPSPVTWDNTLDLFEGAGYSWVHVIGHGTYWQTNIGGQALLVVEAGEKISPNELKSQKVKKHFAAVRPGVVLNICEGARQSWSFSGHTGWANQFISDGASFYLAPAWRISDGAAYRFMETLYAALSNQKTVGEAVRAARLAIRQPGNPAWLAYCIYAHPNAQVSGG